MDLVSVLENMPGFCAGNGASKDVIARAESVLGVRFSDDYRAYLERYGMAQMDGRELTGIGLVDHLDVISVTRECRELARDLPDTWYVIEDLGIDGMVAWQNKDGFVYLVSPDGRAMKVADSLSEYLKQ